MNSLNIANRNGAAARITLEREVAAGPEEVWSLWTTLSGIESWWGPPGFSVTVRSIDVRPGGSLIYMMTATAPEMVEYMEKSGMPESSEVVVTYQEVTPLRRLKYLNLIDFVPGVAPYHVTNQVDLFPTANGTRMELSFDRHHDEMWTQRATMGWEGQLGKLTGLIEAKSSLVQS